MRPNPTATPPGCESDKLPTPVQSTFNEARFPAHTKRRAADLTKAARFTFYTRVVTTAIITDVFQLRALILFDVQRSSNQALEFGTNIEVYSETRASLSDADYSDVHHHHIPPRNEHAKRKRG